MIAFIIRVAVAIARRRDGAAHKRLMPLATILLTTAGFGRFLTDPFYGALGVGPVQYFTSFFGGPIVVVLVRGAYDLATRRRPHPAYISGGLLGISRDMLST
jgi:hypothetical protein